MYAIQCQPELYLEMIRMKDLVGVEVRFVMQWNSSFCTDKIWRHDNLGLRIHELTGLWQLVELGSQVAVMVVNITQRVEVRSFLTSQAAEWTSRG
jgi:hypothetical protein